MTQEERDRLISDIATAVRIRSTDAGLSEEEIHWVRNAIKLQEQSLKLRQAVIEKTLSGLVWMALAAIGAMIVSWATAHGYKP
jgi:hypothetical protein